MAKKVVVDIEVNSKKGVQDVDKLNKSLKTTSENQNKIKDSTNQTADALDKSTKSSKKNTSSLQAMDKASGGLVGGFKAMLKQMWLIVSNPVGLVIAGIVLAISGLTKAFTSTKAGGEKLDQVMAGISATMDVVRDRVLKVGTALMKFFTGDFKGAIQAGKEAVSGFGAEVAKEFNEASGAVKSLQDVTDAVRGLSVSRAKLNRDLIKAKEIIEGETASYAEKKKAIDEVRIAETKQTEDELANAKKKLDAIVLANSLSDSGAEDLDKEAQARIAVINLEAISSTNKTKFNKLEKMAQSQELARIKEIATEKKKIADAEQKVIDDKATSDQKAVDDKIKREQKALDDVNALIEADKIKKEDAEVVSLEEKAILDGERAVAKLEALQLGLDAEGEAHKALAILISDTEILYSNKTADAKAKDVAKALKLKKDQANTEANTERKLADIKLAVMNQSANAVIEIVGRESAVGKAVAVAQAIWNTKEAITKTLAKTPYPYNIPSAIATGVFGLAQVKGILSTPNPTGGGGGGVSAPSAPSAPALPQSTAPSFNVVGSSGTNQLASAIGGQSQQPVQAYVVAGDVSTAQELDRNIVTGASI